MPRADIVDIYSLSPNPNFAKAKDAGIKGIIHKASQYVPDNQYEHRREAALAEGLLWGAYHFTTAASWEEQVDLFCSVVKPDPNTFPWIDHESYRGYTMPLQTAINFMDAIDQKFSRPCGMYSGNVIKEQMIHATDAQRQFLGEHPFWLAQYNTTPQMVDYNHHPMPWMGKAFLWQFTGDGSGPGPHSIPGMGNGIDISQLITNYEDDLPHLAQFWKTGVVL